MFQRLHALVALGCSLSLMMMATGAFAVNYDEAVDGDLSGDRLSPTLVSLSPGVNSLTATTGPIDDGDDPYDQEYLRIDLPAGYQLSQLLLQRFEALTDDRAFIGVQTGTTFSFDPENAFANIGTLLGWVHFGPGSGHNDGDDILPDMGMGGGAMGFTPPLLGPSYTFWLQQTGEETTYQLDFIVTAIPEPASAALALAALAPLAARRRRR